MTYVTCPCDLFHGYLSGLTDKDSDEELNLNLIDIKSKILMGGGQIFLSFTNSQHKIFIIVRCNIVFLFLNPRLQPLIFDYKLSTATLGEPCYLKECPLHSSSDTVFLFSSSCPETQHLCLLLTSPTQINTKKNFH